MLRWNGLLRSRWPGSSCAAARRVSHTAHAHYLHQSVSCRIPLACMPALLSSCTVVVANELYCPSAANSSATIDYNNGTGPAERSFTVSGLNRCACSATWILIVAHPELVSTHAGHAAFHSQAADGMLPKSCVKSSPAPTTQQRELRGGKIGLAAATFCSTQLEVQRLTAPISASLQLTATPSTTSAAWLQTAPEPR